MFDTKPEKGMGYILGEGMLKLALWEINAKNSVYHTNEILFSPNNSPLHTCL